MTKLPSSESLKEAYSRLGIDNPIRMNSEQVSAVRELATSMDDSKAQAHRIAEAEARLQERVKRAARSRCAFTTDYDGRDNPPCRVDGKCGCDVCEDKNDAAWDKAYEPRGNTD